MSQESNTARICIDVSQKVVNRLRELEEATGLTTVGIIREALALYDTLLSSSEEVEISANDGTVKKKMVFKNGRADFV